MLNTIKPFILLLALCLCSCASVSNLEVKTSFEGIGISYLPREDYVLITDVFKNSPANKLKIHKFDEITAVKNKEGDFIQIKDISDDEIPKLLKGKSGDIITLKLNRWSEPMKMKKGRIINEWTVEIPVSVIFFDEEELKFQKYNIQKYKDIEETWKCFTKESCRKNHEKFADKYFEIYLKEKPSEISRDALQMAFMVWGNSRNNQKMLNAFESITKDDYFWDYFSGTVLGVYIDAGKTSEGIRLLEDFSKRVKFPQIKSRIFETLENYYFNNGVNDKAVYYSNEIVKINADEWAVNRSKSIIFESNNLNDGQKAPDFCVKDIHGNDICLDKLKGKYVLLYTSPIYYGSSIKAYDLIKDIYKKFNKFKDFHMIGVFTHHRSKLVKKIITDEKIPGILIVENYEKNLELNNLYNLNSGNKIYLINPEGVIVLKDQNNMIKLSEKIDIFLNKE